MVRARARKVVVDAGGTGESTVALPASGGGGAHAAGLAEGAGQPKAGAAAGQAESDPSAGGFRFRCAGVLMLVTFFFVAPATSD